MNVMARYVAGPMLGVALLALGSTPEAKAAAFLEGDIFASVNNGNVNHYLADGTFVETLNIGAGGFTTGMAFDAAGNLYVTGFTASTVAQFDTNGVPQGNFLTAGDGLSTPESIVFDNSGNAYVGNLGTGIQKYDSTGTFLGNVIGVRVDWIDLAADQTTMYWTDEGSAIHTVRTTDGANLGDFAGGLTHAYALRILPDGGVLVADTNNVKRFNAAGALVDTYDVAGEDSWFALNLNPDGTSFWSGDFGTGNLYEFNLAGGAPTQFINTGVGSGSLFGVGIFGEQTQGCPDCGGAGEPIPEPTSMLLFGLGGVGLGLRRLVSKVRSLTA